MDFGHYNCRDYRISPESVLTTTLAAPCTEKYRHPVYRHESFDELEQRSRSPASFKAKFALLKLPLEVRQQILCCLLPSVGAAGKADVNNVVWQRGNTNVFRVCRQLHDECAELMYGTNPFMLVVTFNGITFRFRYLLPSGMAPTRNIDFIAGFPAMYVRLIKRVVIHVDHVDSYTGMIKFNVGGKGLTHALRRQVMRLVDVLAPPAAARPAPTEETVSSLDTGRERRFIRVSIRVSRTTVPEPKSDCVRSRGGGVKLTEDLEEILAPFTHLCGVREVSVGGHVSSEVARSLEVNMMRRTRGPSRDDNEDIIKDGGMQAQYGVQMCVYGNDME